MKMEKEHSWEKLTSNGSTSVLNPLQRPCSDLADDYDDDLINLPSAQLELASGNVEEIQICRTCRTYSNISIPSAVPSPNSPIQLTTVEGSRLSTVNGSVTTDQTNLTWYNDFVVNESDADVPLLESDSGSFIQPVLEDDHCHILRPSVNQSRKARNQLIISSALCFTFMIAEIIGGHLSNSLAIMTDAAHMLSDLTSFLISLFALWIGSRAPSKSMPFGYYRAEILGAVTSVLLIWVLTGILVYMAACRVIDQSYIIHANIMIIVALIGIVFNVIMGVVLHSCCHCHTHSVGHTHASHSHKGNINVRAAFIHVVGDLLQSIGVLIAACIIKFKPEYHLADPICTFLFSGLVLLTTMAIIKDSVHILMEGFPREFDYAVIKNDLEGLTGVRDVHSLNIWSLTMGKHALIVHLALDDSVNNNQVVKRANRILRYKYNINQSTIQTEPYDEAIMTTCNQCLGP